MRTRILLLGLYADGPGLDWVREVVEGVVAAHSARIVAVNVRRTGPDPESTPAELYDHLADQWAIEHPGQHGGARELVELQVRLRCSLRTWHRLRAAVLLGLCPPDPEPHVCRVPWSAG
ncbi:hypothetical protein AAHZ94_08555 [Streptomyces sp. HSW2009]|uniref:hypothetical protein n=1 Tax=Streptomyces sp. HSW2009 TaxID=3142890 RepID=UPI0032EB79AE